MSIGMIGMNMLNVAEKNWGNRFLMKSSLDLNKWSATADLGMGLSYKFGSVLTSLLVTNGEGYKNDSSDNNERISAALGYKHNIGEDMSLQAGGSYSTLDYDTQHLTILVYTAPEKTSLNLRFWKTKICCALFRS